MTICTFFDATTRAITMVADLSDATLEHYVETGASVLIEVAGDPRTQYVAANEMGEPYLADYTEDERAALASLRPGWVWQMPGRIAVDQRTEEGARTAKIAEMSAACAAHILAGFTSSALGAEHTYPAKPTDQANLTGSILDSLIPGLAPDWTTPFWCADADGVWAFLPHTAAQIQQAGRDGKAAILAAMTKNEGLRAQIMTSTIAEIDLIHW